MKVLRVLKWLALSWTAGAISVPIFYFGFDLNFFVSMMIGFAVAGVSFAIPILKSLRLRLQNPYREEIAYSKHQVREAKKKLAIISRYRFKVRSIHMWAQLSRLYKVSKAIIEMVEKEPMRYKDVQPFFVNYLPATVTLVERYFFLLSKPGKSIEMTESLKEAEVMIDEMALKYDRLLNQALSNDVLTLDVEMKVLKQTFQNDKQWIPTSLDRRK
ncbi:5-bromo-4-chloroindolyl phosphate hydrolysis protein [Bacillus iocasae]|uniref:5-bromo-4-chloroindolyl phosphate hydrolysis protein n=1 Tax=Priestia iocasae TaxID=2291674 RepID=A0ABS2QSN3_9BACI|nr:5-bromo-4-chloroindolyl phosphate hydrolysis protein [Metabacillus iocasae]